MRETYIPLFTSILRSSLWSCKGDTIKVFFTLCASADPEGYVSASIDGIRRIADMPLDLTAACIKELESPDPNSKDISRDESRDGRRIEKVPNGWRIINMEWYREEAQRQAELFRKRKWWSQKGSTARRDARPTERDTDTETDTEREKNNISDTRKRALAPEFKPNAKHEEQARKSGLSMASEFEAFKDHHMARRSMFVDWDAALRTWLRNAVKFSAKSAPLTTIGKRANETTEAEAMRKFRGGK